MCLLPNPRGESRTRLESALRRKRHTPDPVDLAEASRAAGVRDERVLSVIAEDIESRRPRRRAQPRRVQRIWSRGLKPHRAKTFKLSSDKRLNPPEKAIVLSMDEKSSLLRGALTR